MFCKEAYSWGQSTGDVGVEAESPNAKDPLESPSARDMAESKLNAFGLPVPRSMLLRSRSGGGSQRGGRPPLAPVSPDMPSSATSSSRSLNVGQGASGLQAEPCTSGYETPVQVLLPLLARRQLPPLPGCIILGLFLHPKYETLSICFTYESALLDCHHCRFRLCAPDLSMPEGTPAIALKRHMRSKTGAHVNMYCGYRRWTL